MAMISIPKVILAPLAAVNCQAFRRMCHDYGAGLVYTGMIDADELAKDPDKSRKKYFDFSDKEHVAAQIIGSNKENLATSAKILSEEKNVKLIDLNAGCIVGEWLGKKSGAYLVKHPDILEKLLSVVVENSKKPVTCKIRIGWDEPNHKQIAKIVEDCGAVAIAVHARTRKQAFIGQAKWSAIKEVKELVSIPVIGNGDITSPEKAKQMLGQTKCDAVMIGRWAIGNPYCFKQMRTYSETGKYSELSSAEKKKELIKFMQYYSEQPRQKLSEIKQHAKWFMKGAKDQAKIKNIIDNCSDIEELRKSFS